MAEETPKPTPPPAEPSPATPPPGAAGEAAPSPAPASGETPPAAGGPQPDPLSDGTVPTILQSGSGETKGKRAKGVAAISGVYRRADVVTTLVTFGVALLAAGLVLGGYLFITRDKTKTAKVTAPKVTTLTPEELQKLGTFFGGAGAGSVSAVLTITPSTLFNGRLAVNNDLKITGGADVAGGTTLADLTVNKTATLSATTVRGGLSVAGPLNLQSPATLNGGLSSKGDVNATGNGSFGGSVSAGTVNTANLSVTGNLNVAGHLVITGATPSASAGGDVGGTIANVDGTDSSGTVTVNVGTAPASGSGFFVKVTFRRPYSRVPRVVVSPVGPDGAKLLPYVQRVTDNFSIGAAANLKPGTYTFDYWVVQ